MTDIVERLAGYCTDYDGSPIPDGAEPMDGLHCDVLYASMNEIISLRSRAEKAEAERDEARNAVAWANNSLFGSHGFFLSLNGGYADEHHLDRAIERLKDDARAKHRAEATCEKLATALESARTWVEPKNKWHEANARSCRDLIDGALSAYRNVTTVNASGPKGETLGNGGADAGN